MRNPTPSSRRPAVWLALALAMSAASGSVLAGPDEFTAAAQAAGKLLADKGAPSIVAIAAPAAALPGLANSGTATAPAGSPQPGLMSRMHDRASDMAATAMNFIGVPYRRGGNSADTGFDCSGFTRHMFEASLGLMLPRRADEQATMAGLAKVERDELKPGDLVFFNTMRRTFSHVGIYIGDNRFIHAPSRGKDVRTDDLTFSYWAKRFTGARRAELPATAQALLQSSDSQPATH